MMCLDQAALPSLLPWRMVSTLLVRSQPISVWKQPLNFITWFDASTLKEQVMPMVSPLRKVTTPSFLTLSRPWWRENLFCLPSMLTVLMVLVLPRREISSSISIAVSGRHILSMMISTPRESWTTTYALIWPKVYTISACKLISLIVWCRLRQDSTKGSLGRCSQCWRSLLLIRRWCWSTCLLLCWRR